MNRPLPHRTPPAEAPRAEAPRAEASRTGAPRSGAPRAGVARPTLLWIAAAVLGAAAWACTFTVPEGTVAVVARFGDPERLVEDPGLHFKWPAPADVVFPIDKRTHLLDPPVAEFLTLDQKNVELDAFVAWRVDDPRTFLTSLRDRRGADDRIGDLLQSALIGVLKQGPFDDLVGAPGRERNLDVVRRMVTEEVTRRCRENGYGVAIEFVGVERITFPEDNKASVERSMRAAREGFAAQYRSEGNERASKIQTEAKLEESRILAEAKQEALRIRGEGAAEAKRIENASIQQNPELYWRLRSAEIAETALRGALIVLPADHPIGQVFELVRAGRGAAAPAEEPRGGGE